VPIECPQHADPRVHQEVAAFGGADCVRDAELFKDHAGVGLL
jgi:hypothetical protein